VDIMYLIPLPTMETTSLRLPITADNQECLNRGRRREERTLFLSCLSTFCIDLLQNQCTQAFRWIDNPNTPSPGSHRMIG
jgi:hypothetical protein